jgi:hypothetical protein
VWFLCRSEVLFLTNNVAPVLQGSEFYLTRNLRFENNFIPSELSLGPGVA